MRQVNIYLIIRNVEGAASIEDFDNLKDDFDKFKVMVVNYHNTNDGNINDLKSTTDDHKNTLDNHNQRLNDLEN